MSPSDVIDQSPEILNGAPVFRGTRVPIQALLDYLKGGKRIDDFLDEFPTVSRGQAITVLELVREAKAEDDLGIPARLANELSQADLEACRGGEWLLVARRLRRKAWWILSLSMIMLAATACYWLYRAMQTGRYSLLIIVVLMIAYGGWEQFVSFRRRANSLEASARRASFR